MAKVAQRLVPRQRTTDGFAGVAGVDDREVAAVRSGPGLDARLGVTTTGSGPARLRLAHGIAAGSPLLATISVKGGWDAAVDVLDADGEAAELLIRGDGGYHGIKLIGSAGYDPAALRIASRGAWSITLEPVSQAPVLEPAHAVRGRGDRVLRLPDEPGRDGGDVLVRIRAGHGTVSLTCRDEADRRYEVLVNALDGFSGVVRVPRACTLLEIGTSAPWVIELLPA